MNIIFTVIFLLSTVSICITCPDKLIPTLLDGVESSLKMSVTLFCIYAVWMGLSSLAEKSNLSSSIAKYIKPITKRLFKTQNEKACEYLAMNISCNLLGIGGAATPYAVKGISELEKEKNAFAQKLLFVINATSIQILPTTVIALRASNGSITPSDIFLPSLICTIISTSLGCGMFLGANKLWRQ